MLLLIAQQHEQIYIARQSIGRRTSIRDQGYSSSLRNSTRESKDEGGGGEQSVGSGAIARGSGRNSIKPTNTAFPTIHGGIGGIENGPTGDRHLLILSMMVFPDKSSCAQVDLSYISLIFEPDCRWPYAFSLHWEKDISPAYDGGWGSSDCATRTARNRYRPHPRAKA